jgi:hypothetical protein
VKGLFVPFPLLQGKKLLKNIKKALLQGFKKLVNEKED